MAEENSAHKIFELLSRAGKEKNVTVRDDQAGFAAFLDAAGRCRAKGSRFRLIDTGKFSVFELEWLAEAGSDISTSNEARPKTAEIGLIARACSRGNAIVAYLHQGVLARDAEDEASSFAVLLGIGQSGAYIYLTNRDMERRLSDLSELAHACRSAGTGLVYYHHGRLAAGVEELKKNGAWIHLSDAGLEFDEDYRFLLDVIEETSAAGGGVVLHVEKGLDVALLRDIMRAGAFVVFATLPAARGSSLWRLEQQARRRPLPYESYYLYPDHML